MKLSIALLSVLVTVNVVAVLCLILTAGRKRRVPAVEAASVATEAAMPVSETAQAAAEAALSEFDEPLLDLIDQVESTTVASAPRSPGEAGLEAALKRWRRSGNNAPRAADSCRLEHTA